MPTQQETATELFVAGLQNIHAIQRQARAMMDKVIARLDHYPDAKARLIAHLTDKENEMKRAEQILGKLGKDASGVKDNVFAGMGAMTALGTGALKDDVLETSMLTYGLANFEIALYEALIELAPIVGQPDAVPLLEQSLGEEKAMADWLHENLKPTLHRFLELSAQGEKAAH